MNRRTFLRSVVFLSILALLLTMVSYIVRTNGSVKDRFAGFYAEPKDSIQVMFFGSSCVSRSIAPGYIWGEYGIKSYALSSNSQRTMAIKPLIEEALKYKSPEVLVIDTRVFLYDDAPLLEDEAHMREVTDNMVYSVNRIKAINRLTEGTDIDKPAMYMDIIKYHSNIGMLFEASELKKAFYRSKDPEKGFEPEDDYFHNNAYDQWGEVNAIPIDPRQEEILRELIAFVKSMDIDTVFLTSVTLPEEEFEGKAAYIGDIVQKEGLGYVNLNEHYEEMGFDCMTDVSDGVHCNTFGAYKCSDYLTRYLIDNYDLKKKTEDSEDWDEAYELFMKHMKDSEDNLEVFRKERDS